MTAIVKIYTINGVVVTRDEYFEWLDSLDATN